MTYTDGSVYEGEWLRDKRSGKGLLRLRELTTTHSLQIIPTLWMKLLAEKT